MFNLINFCKFFANKKIITTGSRASVGTMKRTSDDRLYFSILGQKIELVFDGAEWQPAAPELFAQEQEQQQAEQAEEQQEQEQQQAEQAQEEFLNNLLSESKVIIYTRNGRSELVFPSENLKTRFDLVASHVVGKSCSTKFPINALIGNAMYRFYPKWTGERYVIPVCRLFNDDIKILPVGKILSSDEVLFPIVPYVGYYFAPKTEQEEPAPAPELEQEEPAPVPELEQEEPAPAPELEQEEPTSPIYRYFETKEGSSIGVCKTGDDTIIGIADKAGNLWSWRNLGKQGKKRVQYTIFGDEQQLNSKELGSIHGAIIEARNFLQAAKKANKSAKAEIKATFLGQEPIKIAEIQLNNAGFYKLTVFTLAGGAIVPKTEPKTEEVPILAIDPVFNEKTEGISAKITKLRELKEQTALILEQLKAEGLSIEQIKALLGN